MKTFSRNIEKLRVVLQNMHSTKHLPMAAPGFIIIPTVSNDCLETSLKIRLIMRLKLNEVIDNKSS